MTTGMQIRPVGPEDIDALGQLFSSQRTTRHCWCMSFCSTRAEFAAGWFGGGNRRRFQAMARGGLPMGVLASIEAVPVGWAACGPRSRYLGADPSRHRLLGDRRRTEDDTVWLAPCVFVHVDHRGEGVSHVLVDAAASLARRHDAAALEAWPLAGSTRRPADAFVGREQLFADLGFRRVAQPVPERVIMRLDLAPS